MRTKEEITTEYSQCAVLLGDKIFKLELLDSEIEGLKSRMMELNTEAARVAQEEREMV